MPSTEVKDQIRAERMRGIAHRLPRKTSLFYHSRRAADNGQSTPRQSRSDWSPYFVPTLTTSDWPPYFVPTLTTSDWTPGCVAVHRVWERCGQAVRSGPFRRLFPCRPNGRFGAFRGDDRIDAEVPTTTEGTETRLRGPRKDDCETVHFVPLINTSHAKQSCAPPTDLWIRRASPGREDRRGGGGRPSSNGARS